MPRPRVIIYFDILPTLDKLTDEQAGALFKGVLMYAREGIPPHFADPITDLMWRLMQSAIDRDGVRYDEVVKSNRYSTYCRECRKHGIDPCSHEDWMAMSKEEIGLLFAKLKSGTI